MRRTARLTMPAAVAMSLLLAACSGGPGGSGGPIAHPQGDELVLRIEFRGGMLGPGALAATLPPFTLTGDGRVIVPGAQIELFPGPLLPAVNVRRLAEDGIQALLAEVTRTGLFTTSVEFRGAQDFVMDAGDTVFTLHAAGREIEVVVFGLGTLDPAGNYPTISAAEIAAHGVLQRLSDRLMNPDSWLGEGLWAEPAWRAYQPEAMRLLVRNADADPPDDSGIGNQLLDWPAGSDPATFGEATSDGERCGVVTGQEATDWYELLTGANQLTRFVSGDHRYQLTVRFMLPDEPPECPAQPV